MDFEPLFAQGFAQQMSTKRELSILLMQDGTNNILIDTRFDAYGYLAAIEKSGRLIKNHLVTISTPMASSIARELRIHYQNHWRGDGKWFVGIDWRDLIDQLSCYNLRTGERRTPRATAQYVVINRQHTGEQVMPSAAAQRVMNHQTNLHNGALGMHDANSP